MGTVGGGVVELLGRHADLVASRTGVRFALRGIADLTPDAGLDVAFDRRLLTDDAGAVLRDPSVQIVIELIGGTGAARELTLAALAAGKPVVTANKALLAKHGPELFRAARAAGVDIFFEASVAGGLPIIRALREGLVADRIESIHGILNGTCNYILTRMEAERKPFEEVLAAAQAAGYAEANPALDVDGHDTAHKAVVLAALAFGAPVPLESVHVRGIRGVSCRDLLLALGLGRRLKLLAILRSTPAGLEACVEPCLVPEHGLMGSVSDVFNAILVRGDPIGETLYYGRGAGRPSTASAIVGDLVDAAELLAGKRTARPDGFTTGAAAPAIVPAGAVESRFYLRVSFASAAGADESSERAWQALARHHVHPLSVQPVAHADGSGSALVVQTRATPARRIEVAVHELGGLAGVAEAPVWFRIEDL